MSEPARRPGGLMQPALLITADLVALEAAFLVTYWFRCHAGIWPVPLGVPPLPLCLLTSAVILLVFFGLFYARGLYGRVALSFEEELASLPVDRQLVPDRLALRTSRLRLTEAGGIPFFGVRATALSGADRSVERIFDLVCTTLGLRLLTALVLFTSPGPVWTVAADPRATPAGRWLRRLSLDELPRYFARHQVRSGLTGWAQVNGLRGNTSIGERTLYDLFGVENWSLGLDIRILLMTVHHVLRDEYAY